MSANVEEHLERARASRREDDPRKAFHHYEKALSLDPDNKTLMLEFADCLVESDKVEWAHDVFNSAHELFPDDATVLIQQARAYLIDGKATKAATVLKKALRLEKGNAEARALLTQAELGKPLFLASPNPLLAWRVELDENHPLSEVGPLVVLSYFPRTVVLKGDIAPAWMSNQADRPLQQAKAACAEGEFSQAIDILKAAEDSDGRDERVNGRIARLHFLMGEYERALRRLSTPSRNDREELDTIKALSHLALCNHDEALHSRTWHSKTPLPLMALIHAHRGAPDHSIRDASLALSKRQIADVLLLRGLMLLQVGKIEEAERDLSACRDAKASHKDKNYKQVLRLGSALGLARVRMARDQNPDAELRAATRASEKLQVPLVDEELERLRVLAGA